MPRICLKRGRCTGAFAAAVFILIYAVLISAVSWAQVPLPPVKPQEAQREKPEDTAVVKYSLGDFAKALLSFNDGASVPVPVPKPFSANSAPLSPRDVARYKAIFQRQEEGRMAQADEEIKALSNMVLRGHMLYQRYRHPTAYDSAFEELRNWLSLYADHPGAAHIYALARRKRPKGFKGQIRKPVPARGIARLGDPKMYEGQVYHAQAQRNAREKAAVKAFRKDILNIVKKSSPDEARRTLENDERGHLLDQTERDILRARIAAGYLYEGQRQKAKEMAARAAARTEDKAPLAAWIAGLSFWQEAEYKKAAGFFEITARSPYSSGWFAAAGAYWAARAHMRAGNVVAVSRWLEKAAGHPRTFYGLIATRALGRNFAFDWSMPPFTKADYRLLTKTQKGVRAMALADTGQLHLAEAELLRVNPGRDDAVRKAFLAYAGYAGMPALALRLGGYVQGPGGQSYDAALYPIGSWVAQDKYKIDPALVHAIIRQESKFDPLAQSASGAVGLMQLMPRTARYMAGADKPDLTDPGSNLEIGQKYLLHLLRDKKISGDLLSLLMAYNAGPGNLSRWRRQWDKVEDPLLFIELIPSGETRSYVEHVLANYWIYSLRAGSPTPSLDAVVGGRKARYAYVASQKAVKLAKKD